MVFGGNSEKLRQFKDFAQNHAVNYIHANDPCPRAWGALNLRHFVQQATLAARNGFIGAHGAIKGRVASTVVEEGAAALLERPDFNLIEDLARKYEHVVPLRVLSTNTQHFRWREFNLKPESLKDHSVGCYVNLLFDAFDSRVRKSRTEQPKEPDAGHARSRPPYGSEPRMAPVYGVGTWLVRLWNCSIRRPLQHTCGLECWQSADENLSGQQRLIKSQGGFRRLNCPTEISQLKPITIGQWRAASMAWRSVEDVLSAEEAAQLRQDTEAELADPKFREKVILAMGPASGSCVCDGNAFILLGPSAAGKSTLLPQMEVPSGAVVMDGSIIRQVSETWQKALQIAKSHELAGLSNYFEKYFKPPMDKLKSDLLEESMRKGVNLIVPDTASNFEATTKMIQRLRAAGYHMRFAAVYGEEAEVLCRGQARASEEGKEFTGKNWRKSVEAILKLQEYLDSTGLMKDCGSVEVIDNSGSTSRPMSLAELRSRLEQIDPGNGTFWALWIW
eukprot:s348_g26.t2